MTVNTNLMPIYSAITLLEAAVYSQRSILFSPPALRHTLLSRDIEIVQVSTDCCQAPLPDELGHLTDGLW